MSFQQIWTRFLAIITYGT